MTGEKRRGTNLTARDLRLVRTEQTGAVDGGAVAKVELEIGHLLVGARCGFAREIVAAVVRDLLRCQQRVFVSATLRRSSSGSSTYISGVGDQCIVACGRSVLDGDEARSSGV